MENVPDGALEAGGKSPSADQMNSGRAWMVAFALLILGVAMAWGQNKILPILTILMDQLGVSAQMAGWISTIMGVLGIAMAIPAASMIRKMGLRKIGILSIIVSIIGSVIGYFSPNEYVLLLSRIIEGFGVGLIGVYAPAAISMWFPPEKRGFPMGVWSSWQVIAIGGVYIFTGMILGPMAEWKNMYVVGFVAMAIALVVFLLFVREPQGDEPNYADVVDSSIPLREVFKSPSLYVVSIASIGFGIAIGTFVAWMPSYWDSHGIMSLLDGNAAIGYIYIGEIFACVFGGLLISKVKKRKKLFAIDAALYAIVLFAAFHVQTYTGAVIVCILYFICEGVFVAAMWTLVPQTVKDPRLVAGALAVFTMFNNFGMMIGAPLSGAVLDMTAMTGWGTLAILAGACQLVAAVLIWFTKLYNPDGSVADI